MNKGRPRLDSACLKGPKIFFHRILIIVSRGIISEKVECEWNFQISEIGNIFVYIIGIKRAMNKGRPRLDSACLKGPKISFHRILIIMSRDIIGEKEECDRNFQISEIGNVFIYNAGIKRVMNKRRPRLNSAYLKGPKISFYRILIIISRGIIVQKQSVSGIFKFRKSEMFSFITQESREL